MEVMNGFYALPIRSQQSFFFFFIMAGEGRPRVDCAVTVPKKAFFFFK